MPFSSRLVSSRLVSSRLVSSAALALALAACGGAESTVQTQQPAAPVVPPNNQDPDCTALPLPAGCEPREPVVPMPLAGLGDAPKLAAAIALREVADTAKVQLVNLYEKDPRESRVPIQGLQLRMSKTDASVGGSNSSLNRLGTKLVDVTSSGSGDKIAYSFGLYTPGKDSRVTAFAQGLRQVMSNPFGNKIFLLENNKAFSSVKRIESIATQFGEGWDYSILKASVPSVKGGGQGFNALCRAMDRRS